MQKLNPFLKLILPNSKRVGVLLPIITPIPSHYRPWNAGHCAAPRATRLLCAPPAPCQKTPREPSFRQRTVPTGRQSRAGRSQTTVIRNAHAPGVNSSPAHHRSPAGPPEYARGPQINDPHADEGVQQGYGNDTKDNHPFALFPPRGRVGQEPRYRHDDFLSSVHLNPTSFKFVLPG